MEEPDRAPSVQIINPEEEQGRRNKAPNRESGQGQPVADTRARGWLDSMQRYWAERQQHLHRIRQRESQSLLSEQDRLTIKQELERFHAAEEKFRRVMEGDCE